jgi:hypothetical protein
MTDEKENTTTAIKEGTPNLSKKEEETSDERVNAHYKVYNLIATTLIALVTLVFAAYLFQIGQMGIGGTIAGMVIAHYFSSSGNSQTVGAIRSVIETNGKQTKTRLETENPRKAA